MEDDDERHRREEQERRAKRKASKGAKSAEQLAKEKQRKEYKQKVLAQVGGKAATASKDKPVEGTQSAFQRSLVQRIDNFCIDFRFRNTAPRPPVGPCFIGQTLDQIIKERSGHYVPNDVEGNHQWQLHTEPITVPLAPYLLDRESYDKTSEPQELHPDDDALLNWKGSMGDTAQDEKKLRQDEARARAKAILTGQPHRKLAKKTQTIKTKSKKDSRVLTEGMQTWMKKTTYLSNDYSRKVHDFKSQAQTQKELAAELQLKQQEIAKHSTAENIASNFNATPVHPHKKQLKPKKIFDILPNVDYWGPMTHVMIDKPPAAKHYAMKDLNEAIIADVEKNSASARMNCQLLAPPEYRSLSTYNLDLEPLKDEDSPATYYTLWLDEDNYKAYYLPLGSRVKLSSGRPARSDDPRKVQRRELTEAEIEEAERRQAEVDLDMAEKYPPQYEEPPAAPAATSSTQAMEVDKEDEDDDDNDDGEGDFGDSDSSGDEHIFGGDKPMGTAVDVN